MVIRVNSLHQSQNSGKMIKQLIVGKWIGERADWTRGSIVTGMEGLGHFCVDDVY